MSSEPSAESRARLDAALAMTMHPEHPELPEDADPPECPEPAPGSDEPGFSEHLPMLYNVVYCSRANAGIDAAAVDRIIATSHLHNPRWGITGMLVFGDNIFFQWLEGPRASILRLMSLLRTDNRHEQIIMLSEVEEARERLFPQWDMELVDADQIRDVLTDALSDETLAAHDADALRALLTGIDARLGAAPP